MNWKMQKKFGHRIIPTSFLTLSFYLLKISVIQALTNIHDDAQYSFHLWQKRVAFNH